MRTVQPNKVPASPARGSRNGLSTMIVAALESAEQGTAIALESREVTLKDEQDTPRAFAKRLQSTLYYPTDSRGFAVTVWADEKGEVWVKRVAMTEARKAEKARQAAKAAQAAK